jgi:hypothetical protein
LRLAVGAESDPEVMVAMTRPRLFSPAACAAWHAFWALIDSFGLIH